MISIYLIITVVLVISLLIFQDRAINLLIPLIRKLSKDKKKEERKKLESGIYFFYYSLGTILVALFWLIYATILSGTFVSRGITIFILVLGVFFSYITYKNLIEAFFLENLDKELASEREKSKQRLLKNLIKKTNKIKIK